MSGQQNNLGWLMQRRDSLLRELGRVDVAINCLVGSADAKLVPLARVLEIVEGELEEWQSVTSRRVQCIRIINLLREEFNPSRAARRVARS